MVENPVERRLAAILAADVVGYSKLMGQDEAGTLARLRRMRTELTDPKIAEHKGRLFKTTGDGFLVEFPSVVNAVACAVAIQRGLAASKTEPPVQLRIGINLGDVVIEGDDVFGDGVNVAARLEAIAPAGGVAISGTVRDHLGKHLDLTFEDMGERALKNIERPVRTYSLVLAKPTGYSSDFGQDRPSIAVLPFVNMSGDPEQEYFADGLTEDIITALSRSIRIGVIARTSSFTYKGKATDVKRIAQELDAAFILEGSVRRAGNRIRITAQLIDGGNGAHLWAEKFDGHLDDIFEIQDDITRSVAASTQTSVLSMPKRTARSLELIRSPAHRLAYEALIHMYQMTPESHAKASELAEKALALDPECGLALRLRANAYSIKLILGDIPHSPENLEHGIELAREALRREPDDEMSHWMMSLALSEAGQLDEAMAALDIGLSINPNASMLIGDKGDYLVFLAKPEEGIALCELALKLNPRDPIGYWWENSIATAHFLTGRTVQALEESRRVSLKKPDHVRATIIWAAAAGELGRAEEAREAIGRCLARFPQMRLSNVIPHHHLAFRRAEDNQRLMSGLNAAGLPK